VHLRLFGVFEDSGYSFMECGKSSVAVLHHRSPA